MPTLRSNKLVLNNLIPEDVQRDFLSDYRPIVYCIAVADYERTIERKFYNWDELVEFARSAHEIFEQLGTDLSEFKIWTETEDFSDFLDYNKQSDTSCS